MTKKIVITSGLALFTMFFGAGNIIYPLELGAQAGSNILYVVLAFLLSAIGLPLLGLFATSLYHGDYWDFFKRLGKIPAFLLISFLLLIIGPLFAIPRTEAVTFHTMQPFLSAPLNNPYLFSGLYCILLFLLTYQHRKVVDVIGRFLSPIKLALFTILIIDGLMGPSNPIVTQHTVTESIKMGLLDGYSTMDLLATFFFCTVVYENILAKAKLSGINKPNDIVKIFLYSCVLGGILLGFVYVGFLLLAYNHASDLQGVDTANMIVAISNLVLGRMGSLFVGICVSFACIVTAIALTDVTTSFIYDHIVLRKIPRRVCLVLTISITFAMSIIGFVGIMKIALPILEILYPALIIYCIIAIIEKLVINRKKLA